MNSETVRYRAKKRRPGLSIGCAISFLVIIAIMAGLLAVIIAAPILAEQAVGPASPNLGFAQRVQYSFLMVYYADQVTNPLEKTASEIPFKVEQGEGAAVVAANLERTGIIRNADAFTAYLVYSGLDTGIQAGEFQLSPALSPQEIAKKLQDATPAQVKFAVLPGWRLEEVAASLPTSGFLITPQEFLQVAQNPSVKFDFLPAGASAEGFLLPGEYVLPRVIKVNELVTTLMNNTALALTPELRAGFARQNLSVYEAVTLASIVQREAVRTEEQPQIASVFLNRLAAGMKLQTDPTIQYALGFNPALNTWWKSPLSETDLQVSSAYNTYEYAGLPPGPICSPSLSALQAVAYPAQTPYYYFRARCDGSGLHNFSETYDQHVQNGCP